MKTLSPFDLMRRLLMSCLLGLMGVAGMARAHDIPADVRLSSLARVQGQSLVLLIRAPMSAMREADIPLNGPYLDMDRAAPALQVAARLWFVDRIKVNADGQPASPTLTHVRVSLPSDVSFNTWDSATQHLQDPPLQDRDLVWQQQYLDARLVYALPQGASQNLSIDFDAGKLGGHVVNNFRYTDDQGQERSLLLTGDTGPVALNPGPWSAIQRFTWDGVTHILSGLDHLLFIACLVLGFQNLRGLVWTVTGFTLAHSITLVLSALGLTPQGLWFAPAVEWAIAASILWAVLDVLLWPQRSHRWILASALGLVHGLGLSFALREALPFAGQHVVLALASFNVGVELGQILVLLIAWPLWLWLRQHPRQETCRLLVCILIAHTAWHWMGERWEVLNKFLEAGALEQLGIATSNSPIFWLCLMAAAIWMLWKPPHTPPK